eukprot:Nitzschia sp. Nitz4//scaffold6_size259037//138112//139081//NITZ4_001082-RA/size259037-augustus-gene-0.294-mRNA-1//1//CDS//3329556917//753//frame0
MNMNNFDQRENGGKVPFPFKLFQMLHDADELGFRHIISWNSNGKAFKVHDPIAFTNLIIPRYFKQTRYKSFQRQLCLYGFDRVLTGPHKGSRYHKNFVRGDLVLCQEVKYIGIKSKALPQADSAEPAKPASPKREETVSAAPSTPPPKPTMLMRPRLVSMASMASMNMLATGESEKRIVSPSMSPLPRTDSVLSGQSSLPTKALPHVPILSDSVEDPPVGLFEGKSFHVVDALPEENMAKIQMELEFDATATLSVGSGDNLFNKQMNQAWRHGFAQAMAMPEETYKSLMTEQIQPMGLLL